MNYTPELKSKILDNSIKVTEYINNLIDSKDELPIYITLDESENYIYNLVISECLENKQGSPETGFKYSIDIKDFYDSNYTIDLKTLEGNLNIKRHQNNYNNSKNIRHMLGKHKKAMVSDTQFYEHKVVYKKLLLIWSRESEDYPEGFKIYLKNNINSICDVTHMETFKV